MQVSQQPGHARRQRRVPARQAGVTLLELIVTIAVAAILLALAVPSFTSVINGNRITAAANELMAGIQSARMEAIRRNARVVLCRSDNGLTCKTGGGDWQGWISFVDTDANNTPDGGADSLLRTFAASRNVVLLSSPAIAQNRIVVRPDGMIRSNTRALVNAKLRVCMRTSMPSKNMREITLNAGSRLSITSGTDATCTTPPNT